MSGRFQREDRFALRNSRAGLRDIVLSTIVKISALPRYPGARTQISLPLSSYARTRRIVVKSGVEKREAVGHSRIESAFELPLRVFELALRSAFARFLHGGAVAVHHDKRG